MVVEKRMSAVLTTFILSKTGMPPAPILAIGLGSVKLALDDPRRLDPAAVAARDGLTELIEADAFKAAGALVGRGVLMRC